MWHDRRYERILVRLLYQLSSLFFSFHIISLLILYIISKLADNLTNLTSRFFFFFFFEGNYLAIELIMKSMINRWSNLEFIIIGSRIKKLLFHNFFWDIYMLLFSPLLSSLSWPDCFITFILFHFIGVFNANQRKCEINSVCHKFLWISILLFHF